MLSRNPVSHRSRVSSLVLLKSLAELIHMDSREEKLPTREDFGADYGCLDAICAWEDFGGLDLADAYVKFCEGPDIYQEDFMFMDDVAFVYYFPVLDRYIRESRAGPENDFDVDAMWVLAYCIEIHFTEPHVPCALKLRHRVEELISYVRGNLPLFCKKPKEQQLAEPHVPCTLKLRRSVEELIFYVRGNLPLFCKEPKEQQRIDSAWQELQDRMASLSDSGH
ncbi:MAG: hypothetical protein ACI8P0_001994 [Planctomycetaceae bacterium]|jgi:hypothetical protein